MSKDDRYCLIFAYSLVVTWVGWAFAITLGPAWYWMWCIGLIVMVSNAVYETRRQRKQIRQQMEELHRHLEDIDRFIDEA